jgi:SAD/SRA domain
MTLVGHAGAVEGQLFDGRAAIQQAGLHRHNQRGISGTASEPAEAIVLSGGYRDDIDLGDEVIYTGEGGRDATTGNQIADQTMTGGNAALGNSNLEGSPVRVVLGLLLGRVLDLVTPRNDDLGRTLLCPAAADQARAFPLSVGRASGVPHDSLRIARAIR